MFGTLRKTLKRARAPPAGTPGVALVAAPAPARRRRRSRRVVSGVPRTGMVDWSLRYLNPGPSNPKINVVKTRYNSFTYQTGAATGNQVQISASGQCTVSVFDPAGVRDNICGLGTGLSGITSEWALFAQLYDKYKVNWIEVSFEVNNATPGTASFDGLTLWNRWNYDSGLTPSSSGVITCGAVTGTVQPFQYWRNVRADHLTPDKQMFVYRFVPKIQLLSTASVFSATGEKMATAGWMDVDFPAPLFGLVTGFPYSLPATVSLTGNVTYSIDFKSDL